MTDTPSDPSGAQTVLLWYWRHYFLDVSIEDTFEDALLHSESIQDAEVGVPHCIEIWDESGYRKLDASGIHQQAEKLARERWGSLPRPKPVVAMIDITSPEGKETCYSTFSDMARAEEVMEELKVLGDRVRLKVLR